MQRHDNYNKTRTHTLTHPSFKPQKRLNSTSFSNSPALTFPPWPRVLIYDVVVQPKGEQRVEVVQIGDLIKHDTPKVKKTLSGLDT